ncbi:hypothetical protein LARI1_G006419 [Lachnellula arida]|uniref:Uncharacterized protein n=1 Tax=Lachnellula arida TaxID=1316785 RepID=A0A8T9B545_9HELO|nr:hypothetical protein LARI1_G006419 [Lachnellula arida]
MDPQQRNLEGQVEVVDEDEVPPQYRVERHTSKLGRTRGSIRSKSGPRRRDNRSIQTPQAAPVNNPPWLFRVLPFFKLVSPASQQSSSNTAGEREQKENVGTLLETQGPQKWGCDVDQTQISQQQIIELEHQFQSILQVKECEWTAREKDLQTQIHQVQQYTAERDQVLQAEIHDIQLAKSALEKQHNALIRKQQEASFRQMESARWLPVDETKSLGEVDTAPLMQQLSNVVVFENGHLPESISTTAKSAMLLLNALLCDNIYMTFFRSPFFLLGEASDSSANGGSEGVLEDIYQRAKSANPQDAHIWRSQTLRLLMPPLRNDISEGEKKLHHTIEDATARVAQQQATAFLAGPASLLVENNTKSNVAHKLEKIYDEAARKSYMLWTRRTEMRCYTLRDIKQPGFDAESPFFDPDTLMRYEDHEGQLKDRPVTVLVHPLLQVAGTDEAKDYDEKRVWAKGVVWLDSKMA